MNLVITSNSAQHINVPEQVELQLLHHMQIIDQTVNAGTEAFRWLKLFSSLPEQKSVTFNDVN